jgi:tetratricopeptide (TPR) repeat protein
MMLKRIPIILLLLLTGCSQSFYSQGKKFVGEEQYDRAVEAFYKEIAAHPQDAAAWRELGVAYYEKGDLTKAEEALKQANSIRPDPRTQVFLGLIDEKRENYKGAIDAYGVALSLDPDRKTRSLINAHLDRLLYRKISGEVAGIIQNEADIKTDTIPTNTVAVVNFDGSHLSQELAPLAIGLAELASSDLAKIKSLDVVERLKIDVIQDELKLGGSGYVDPASAPRMGKLLGSSRVITGSLMGVGDQGLRLDGVVVSTSDSATEFTQSSEGTVQKFFDIEKKFVFDVVDKLGVSLTPEERNAIKEVPTESYLAFLAYSRGLDYERRGQNDAAGREFQSALQHDKNFGPAQSGAQKAAAGGLGSTGYDNSLKTLESFAAAGGGAGEPDGSGLDARLDVVIHSTGLIPGESLDRPTKAQPRITGIGRVVIRVDYDNH